MLGNATVPTGNAFFGFQDAQAHHQFHSYRGAPIDASSAGSDICYQATATYSGLDPERSNATELPTTGPERLVSELPAEHITEVSTSRPDSRPEERPSNRTFAASNATPLFSEETGTDASSPGRSTEVTSETPSTALSSMGQWQRPPRQEHGAEIQELQRRQEQLQARRQTLLGLQRIDEEEARIQERLQELRRM
jgi:hypothetical protein